MRRLGERNPNPFGPFGVAHRSVLKHQAPLIVTILLVINLLVINLLVINLLVINLLVINQLVTVLLVINLLVFFLFHIFAEEYNESAHARRNKSEFSFVLSKHHL